MRIKKVSKDDMEVKAFYAFLEEGFRQFFSVSTT